MILFIAILIFIYSVTPNELLIAFGVSNSFPIGCLLYHFAHASWLHLIINCISLFLLYKPIRNIYSVYIYCIPDTKFIDIRYKIDFFLKVYACATLAGLFAAQDLPTVGASGIIYSLMGMLIALMPTKQLLLNYLWLIPALIIQIIFAKSNVALHCIAFVLGYIEVAIHFANIQRKNGTAQVPFNINLFINTK